ncbi:sensor histidine kinase [Anaerotignum sp.]|uniref:sensor histidine kinase n=1 Tax=Anaerotignum sp. TaxID=2039241 RepID=UPI00289DBADF|nr:HAMP domain-containing sensor histidine kinase [Anaerotignum sp.]
MKTSCFSVRKIVLTVSAGAVITALSLMIGMYALTGNSIVFYGGLLLTTALLLWGAVLVHLLQKKLLEFTSDLCRTLDGMMNGHEKPEINLDEESLLTRISHRLERLYHTMLENRRKLEVEKSALQTLVADISHQTKTPIANLKMITDTLLGRSVPEEKQKEFLTAAGSQLDKLDFMIQALVKTSRLETGLIVLEKKSSPIYETIVTAVNGVLSALEKKELGLLMTCPEDLCIVHDPRWTAEALFNLLDNAVKYTSVKGNLHIVVQEWEMYVKLDIIDTGKGIPESEQAAIFKRFYRGDTVHEVDGIGIGLYLVREIITMQGGYIKVRSEVGKGSTFSVFLPR